MELFDKQLKDLLSAFSGIQHYQRIVENNTKKLLNDLSKAKVGLEGLDSEAKDIFGSSVNAFYFYSPYTGTATPYDAKKTSIDEAIELTFLHKNKQYQWLLADAYEAYEDYLEAMYACAGFIDPLFWPEKDFESQDPSGAKSLGFQWFLEKSKNKRGAPGTIMAHFRSKLPNLAKIERNNLTNNDLRLTMCIIEKIRHIIVHKNGKTEFREHVIDSILKSANILNNKRLEPVARSIVSDHFGKGEYSGLVILVEKPMLQSNGISMVINHHDNLLGAMLGHSLVLRNELVALFGKGGT